MNGSTTPNPRVIPFIAAPIETASDFNGQATKANPAPAATPGAKDNEHALPEIQDACQLLREPPKIPPVLIDGLLHAGSKLVLGGGSKSYKTWGLLDLGISVGTGHPFWGFPCTQGRVLFVNFELQAGFLTQRIQEICAARGIQLEESQLGVLNLRGLVADPDAILQKISLAAKRNDYALIIFDPLYKLLGGRDENSAKDMTALMNSIERVAVHTGSAIAFGCHFAKGNASGKESMDRISGSGVFARDPDAILTMTRHEQEDCFTVDMTLRNFPPQKPFVVRRQHPLMVPDTALDPATLKQAGGRAATFKVEDILEVLRGRQMTATEWQNAVTDKTGMCRRKFYNLKSEAESAGRVGRVAGTSKLEVK